MGEAWSDWYAMDYLVNQGLVSRTRPPPATSASASTSATGSDLDPHPADRLPGRHRRRRCPGTAGAGAGGYTYGDYGKIVGAPEVHADGEIWGQTLWDLRNALGSQRRPSRWSPGRWSCRRPTRPSSTSATRSCQADTALTRRHGPGQIWQVFAHPRHGLLRRLRSTATTSAPVEDFSLPPRANAPDGER